MPPRLSKKKIGTINFNQLIMSKNDSLTIGITMRITHPSNYKEPRDTIAQDWSNYMLSNFKDEKWIVLPNLGKDITSYVDKFNINALIFSGGENIGVSPNRDQTEQELLKYAQCNRIPVLAICRGLQIVYDFYGGNIIEGGTQFRKDHIANRHIIKLQKCFKEVNSYHGNFLDEGSLPKGFRILARSECENSIEAINYKHILGLMWHPERELPYQTWESELIYNFLKYKKILKKYAN